MLSLGLLLLAACSTTHRKGYTPMLEEVQKLRGLSAEAIKEKIGNPADIQGGRVFYFLTADSKYHPEPKAQLFELIFKNNQLLEIRRSSQ